MHEQKLRLIQSYICCLFQKPDHTWGWSVLYTGVFSSLSRSVCPISIFCYYLSFPHVISLYESQWETLSSLRLLPTHAFSSYNLFFLYTLNNLLFISFHMLFSFSHSLHLSLNEMNTVFLMESVIQLWNALAVYAMRSNEWYFRDALAGERNPGQHFHSSQLKKTCMYLVSVFRPPDLKKTCPLHVCVCLS